MRSDIYIRAGNSPVERYGAQNPNGVNPPNAPADELRQRLLAIAEVFKQWRQGGKTG